jgi:cyclophilin family peptidyl-prolyl cis-trans isomerase
MRFARFVLNFLALAVVCASRAQSTTPANAGGIPAQTLAPGGAARTTDLRDYFTLPGVSGQVVQFDTVMGKFNAELLANDAPLTVANFLNYVNRGAYSNTLVHRSISGFVVQGGGFTYSISTTHIPTDPPVVNEFKLSNVRGTLAMAKVGGDPNSATSEWFVNLANNSANLDNQNGGFTVFARVLGTGMSVADAIAALPTAQSVTFPNGTALSNVPLRNYTSGSVTLENLVVVNSIATIGIHPADAGTAVLTYSASSGNNNVATAAISGSTLTLAPVASGTTTVTVRATDTNGNVVDNAFAVTVAGGPVFTAQPGSLAVAVGGAVTFTADVSGATSLQWQRNGVNLPGQNGPTLTLGSAQPSDAGVYVLLASDGATTRASDPAVLGLLSDVKLVGLGQEFPNIFHPGTGHTYDQILLQGTAATITADPDQIVRMSYIDLNDDIIQVEFSGAGALTLNLDEATPPAPPVKYIQPTISYMRGRGSIVIAGANENTHVSVFSVGRANSGNPQLFRDDVSYDGMADIAFLAVVSNGGAFGSIRTANSRYGTASGIAGLYAPRTAVAGPVFVGEVLASGEATPAVVLGRASDVRINGGSLHQPNGRDVQVDGMTKLQMVANQNSHGVAQPAQVLDARLVRGGIDVSDQLSQP